MHTAPGTAAEKQKKYYVDLDTDCQHNVLTAAIAVRRACCELINQESTKCRTLSELPSVAQIKYASDSRFNYAGCSPYDLVSHYFDAGLMYCTWVVSPASALKCLVLLNCF